MKLFAIIAICILILSCRKESPASTTMEAAGKNATQLKTVLNHYEGNDTLSAAALFLIRNMYNKSHTNEQYIAHYDPYFEMLSRWKDLGLKNDDDPQLNHLWDSLVATDCPKDGVPHFLSDCQTLSADYLIENIDLAYQAWLNRPTFSSEEFDDFLDFVLPYRVAHEPPQWFRAKYLSAGRNLIDSATTPREFLIGFNKQNHATKRYRGKLLSFPYDLPIDRFEGGLIANCHQNAIFCASAIRALGIPVAIDFVHAWGNRNSGHEWCSLLLKDGHIYPFNSFEADSALLEYKPAKIFRRTYSVSPPNFADTSDVPSALLDREMRDVTNHYGITHDISVPIKYNSMLSAHKVYGVICVFDNRHWVPIWYGPCDDQKMLFNRMLGDVLYIAAYYHHGEVVPASDPFVLSEDGALHFFNTNHTTWTDTMVVLRKYPYFRRMETHAIQLRLSTIEGANDSTFRDATILAEIDFTPHDTAAIEIQTNRRFRYLRLNIKDFRLGNLAEVAFYGKDADGSIRRLDGEIIGAPTATEGDRHSYIAAMDGDYDTYFQKPKNTCGYVGLDLGAGNAAVPVKVTCNPRSDTNYIIPGNRYELKYWEDGGWKSFDIKTATYHRMEFHNVPQGTVYWLRNLTAGNEERIFTYEDGRQIWW